MPGETGSLLRSLIKAKPLTATSPSSGTVRAFPLTAAVIWTAALSGWLILLWGATNMDSPLAQLMMPMTPSWSLANWLAVFAMWSVMMAAMMLPSATPMVLTFSALNRKRGEDARSLLFVAGYLFLWTAFGAMAVTAQWALQSGGLLSPMIVSTSAWLTGILLLIAGVFQFTPFKHACLRACRSPFGFLMSEWQEGLLGAWRMGIRHGLYCLGCCWALMALLFVGGVMNILWIAALAALVAIEKLVPKGEQIARVLGVFIISAGVLKLAWPH